MKNISATRKPTIVVGIATAGRRDELTRTMAQLALLRPLPDRVLICPAGPDDYDESASAQVACPVQVVRGPRGLCAQRNVILSAATDADLIAFFDDDFYPAPDYMAQALRLFENAPGIVMATHHPALDGASTAGVSHEEALRALDSLSPRVEGTQSVQPTYGGYGCNMVIRLTPVFKNRLQFDENLPLYGWLEDIDFSRRLARFGAIVVCDGLRGVHLGTKRGRQSGVRLGYSQVANPLYMIRKGSMSVRFALVHIARNLAMNAARSLDPEPWVDRRGRLKGNALAVRDLVTGRLHPAGLFDL